MFSAIYHIFGVLRGDIARGAPPVKIEPFAVPAHTRNPTTTYDGSPTKDSLGVKDFGEKGSGERERPHGGARGGLVSADDAVQCDGDRRASHRL